MKTKKVILFMPSVEGGGVEKNFFIIANYLSKKINNLSIITTFTKKGKFKNNINVILPGNSIWEKFGRRTKYIICLWLLLKEIIKDNNRIIFAFQANIYCIILCKIFNIPILTRSNTAPDGWSNNIIKKALYKFFLAKANVVIVNSLEFKRKMLKYFNLKTICIYNPLNKKQIIDLSKKKSKKIFYKKNSLKIINIGRIVDQKNQIILLKALNKIKKEINFEAVIMGRGILKNKLNNYINDNKLNKLIKIINYQANPFSYLIQSDIFILSSKFEGLPNVLLEALVLNKFIISSNCPTGPKEILLKGKGGLLFKNEDFKDLADKILFYKNNKIKCKKMLKASINSLERFDENKNLDKYFKLIKSL